MSDPARPIAEEELHAWIDDQLEPERLPAVLRYLQEQPEVAQQVAAWRDQREALRSAFAPVAAEPIPPRLGLERLIQAAADGGSGCPGGRRRRSCWRSAWAAPGAGSCMAASRRRPARSRC